MITLNKISIIGHVGSKDVVNTNGDYKITKFSVATNEKNRNGESLTDWHRIVCFGKLSEIAERFVDKGKKIYVEGRVSYNKFTNKEGVEVKTTDIIANNIIMLDGLDSNKGNVRSDYDDGNEMPAASNDLDDDDDIPF